MQINISAKNDELARESHEPFSDYFKKTFINSLANN